MGPEISHGGCHMVARKYGLLEVSYKLLFYMYFWLRGLATVLICSSPLKWHSHYLTVVLHRRVEMGVRRRYKIERSAPPSSVITVPVM